MEQHNDRNTSAKPPRQGPPSDPGRDEWAGSKASPGGSEARTQEHGQQATEEVREKAAHTAEQARQQASELTEDAKQRGRSMLGEQKDHAAEQMGSVAKALHETAHQLSGQEQRLAGNLIEDTANRIDRASHTLRERDVDSLLGEVQHMAQRQPTLFIGGSIALGFALSRFLKSSSPSASDSGNRQETRATQVSDARTPDATADSGQHIGAKPVSKGEPRPQGGL